MSTESEGISAQALLDKLSGAGISPVDNGLSAQNLHKPQAVAFHSLMGGAPGQSNILANSLIEALPEVETADAEIHGTSRDLEITYTHHHQLPELG